MRRNENFSTLFADLVVAETNAPVDDLYEAWVQDQKQDLYLQTILHGGTISDLNLKPVRLRSGSLLYCDFSESKARIYVPANRVSELIDREHQRSHAGQKATSRLIKSRFVWPHMSSDIQKRVRACESCSRFKPQRPSTEQRTQPALTFDPPAGRFSHVHIDIVGPLPPSEGKRFLFTFIDRASRWFEVVPAVSIDAEATVRAFVTHWISRYGVPETVTTDRGSQFESDLFTELTRVLGIHRIRTTAYHPAANGLVERLHRTLKEAIATKQNRFWTRELPLILLYLRSTPREGDRRSAAEATFGTTLTLPADMVADAPMVEPTNCEVIDKFVQGMAALPPRQFTCPKLTPTQLGGHDKPSWEMTYVRRERDHGTFRPLYDGPYRILRWISDRVAEVDLPAGPATISIDRLRRAHIGVAPTAENQIDSEDSDAIESSPSRGRNVVLEEPAKPQDVGAAQEPRVRFNDNVDVRWIDSVAAYSRYLF